MECDDHHCAVEATSANIVTEFVFHFCLYFHLYLYSCGVWSMMTIIGQWRPHRLIDLKFIHTEYISKSPQPYHMTAEMEIDFAQNCFIRTMHRYDVPCRNHKRVTFFLLRHVVYTACRALPPFVPGVRASQPHVT